MSQQTTYPEISDQELYDVVIIGGGPAGLNAALYAKRKGLTAALITMQVGGQVMNTSSVENYLGTKFATGANLVQQFIEHVHELEVPISEYMQVTKIIPEEGNHGVELMDGRIIHGRTLIIATGTENRKLGIPGEDKLYGRGVAYCATCDAPLYKNKTVVITGGGNSAVEGAIDLAKVAKHVTLVQRSVLRADKILIEEMNAQDNVDVYLQTQILSIEGDDMVDHVHVLDKEKQEEFDIPAEGVFVEIGSIPNSQLVEGIVELNDQKEIIVDKGGMTSVPGIFAAGDVRDIKYKQIIIATSDGANAALAINDYLTQLNAKQRAQA